VLRGAHKTVDTDGFNAAMARQREEARKAWAGSGEKATDALWFDVKDKTGATEFLGYALTEAEGRVLALVKDGKTVDSLASGEKGFVVVNQTPFYGESGGQTGDRGTISCGADVSAVVTDTQKKLGDLFVHAVTVEKGVLKTGTEVLLTVDADRRRASARHHSATHLLQAALRRVLGDHVTQKGSCVSPDSLRFDFSQPRQITADELRRVEDIVNGEILKNLEVVTRIMTPEAAVNEGAMALFGEKYGDEVRVVSMGGGEDRFSLELCGGTHVKRTGDIGSFRIVSEGALAAGVRRIEAVTGLAALQYTRDRESALEKACEALKVAPRDLPERLAAVLDERKKLEKEMAQIRAKAAAGDVKKETIGAVSFIGRIVDDIPAKELKGLIDTLKKQVGSGVVAVASKADGKLAVVIGVTSDLTAKISAVDLVRAGAAAAGGNGGGKPEIAQAGCADATKAGVVMDAVKKALEKLS